MEYVTNERGIASYGRGVYICSNDSTTPSALLDTLVVEEIVDNTLKEISRDSLDKFFNP